MQLKGLKTPGLVKWVRENIPGAEKVRTAKQAVVPIETAISAGGGEVDYRLVNLHLMERVNGFGSDVFQDLGIYDSPDVIAEGSYIHTLHTLGALEAVLTLEEPRPANGELYTTA